MGPRETFEVPEVNLGTLRAEIDRLAKRARRLGLTEPTIEVLGRGERPSERDPDTVIGTVRVRVTGEAPKLPGGWTLLAVIEPVDLEDGTAEYLCLTVPGAEVPPDARPKDMGCVHCGTRRRRNQVFLCRSVDGAIVQVGSTCIADYLGHDNPAALAACAEILRDLLAAAERAEADPEAGLLGGFGGGELYVPVLDFLAFAAAAIRSEGWTSRGAAYDSMGTREATADTAMGYIHALTRGRIADPRTDRDHALAAEALAYIREAADRTPPDDRSDYTHNLFVACRMAEVTDRTAGLVASAVPFYSREAEKLRDAAEHLDEHTGTVGKRGAFTVTVTGTTTIEGMYGPTTIHRFRDPEGRSLVWFGSAGATEKAAMEPGETYRVKATVKAHGEFKGRKQTTVQRVAVLGEGA
jgi:hypothetical protein